MFMSDFELPRRLMKRWKKAHENGLRALRSEHARNTLGEYVEELQAVCDELVGWREEKRKKSNPSNTLEVAMINELSILIEQFEHEASTRSLMLLDMSLEALATYKLTWQLNPFLESQTFRESKRRLTVLKELEENKLFTN